MLPVIVVCSVRVAEDQQTTEGDPDKIQQAEQQVRDKCQTTASLKRLMEPLRPTWSRLFCSLFPVRGRHIKLSFSFFNPVALLHPLPPDLYIYHPPVSARRTSRQTNPWQKQIL